VDLPPKQEQVLSLGPVLVDPAYAEVRASKVDAFLEQLQEVVDEDHRASR